jgi:tripartite-type tricarboxylate transporter receptor subunit TctC
MIIGIALRCAGAAFVAVAAVSYSFGVQAADYPERPLRFIVPFPSGGGVDIVARLVARPLSDSLKIQVVVDNRPGAAGTLGTDIAAKANPDGYTMILGSVGPVAFSPSLYRNLPYDPVRDFTPVSLVASLPNVLLVNPSSQFHTVKDVIATARKNPRELNYASAGSGTPPHLSMELFKSMANIDIIHIPYKGGPPALADLMGARVQLMFINILTALPHVKAGRLRALAVTTAERNPVLPDVPTMAQAGDLPGFAANDWFGILVPANTPGSIVARLNREIVAILSGPETRSRLSGQGAEPLASTPEEFAVFIKTEIVKWGKVIKASGARVD